MENVTTKTAATILGVEEKSFEGMPERIINGMLAAIEMIDTDTEEQCKLLHDTLYDLWSEGCIYADMEYISKETGAELDTLLSLDQQTQMQISFDYTTALSEKSREEAVKAVYNDIHYALQVKDIAAVAELLGISSEQVSNLPYDVKAQLCGAYDMQYDADGDNTQLIDELKEILKEHL